MQRLGDAPENLVHPREHLPVSEDPTPEGLPQVEMCALGVLGIETVKRCNLELMPVGSELKFRLQDKGRLKVLVLFRSQRIGKEEAKLA